MSLTACVLCHHEALRPRWVGDLLMTYCDRCGCLYIPEPTPAAGAPAETPSPRGFGGRAHRSSGRPAVPATVAQLLLAAT